MRVVLLGQEAQRFREQVVLAVEMQVHDALRQAGREVVPMLYGIVLMLIIAAFVEAFWSSSSSLPIELKYSVGALLWGLVLLYCFSGRRYESR